MFVLNLQIVTNLQENSFITLTILNNNKNTNKLNKIDCLNNKNKLMNENTIINNNNNFTKSVMTHIILIVMITF